MHKCVKYVTTCEFLLDSKATQFHTIYIMEDKQAKNIQIETNQEQEKREKGKMLVICLLLHTALI